MNPAQTLCKWKTKSKRFRVEFEEISLLPVQQLINRIKNDERFSKKTDEARAHFCESTHEILHDTKMCATFRIFITGEIFAFDTKKNVDVQIENDE